MAVQVGLRVRNKNRVLQIDGEYKNHELVSVGTYAMASTDNGLWGVFADIPVPPGRTNALIAVSKQDRGVYVKKLNSSTFRIFAGQNTSATSGSVKVYMFAEPIQRASTGKIGLIVRSRITGQVVYDSSFKYLRILGFVQVNLAMPIDANVPPTSASFNYPGKEVAIIQCLRPYGRRQNPSGNPQLPVGVFGFFGGTMRTPDLSTALIEHRVIASAVGPNGSDVASQTLGAYIVVDVTNYTSA